MQAPPSSTHSNPKTHPKSMKPVLVWQRFKNLDVQEVLHGAGTLLRFRGPQERFSWDNSPGPPAPQRRFPATKP